MGNAEEVYEGTIKSGTLKFVRVDTHTRHTYLCFTGTCRTDQHQSVPHHRGFVELDNFYHVL